MTSGSVLTKRATTSATAGLIFLGSCIVNRPLAYYAAKRFAGAAAAGSSTPLQTASHAQTVVRFSLVWGWVCSDAALRIACIYLLSPDVAAGVSQALMVAAYTLLIAYTIYTAKKTAKQHSAVAPADSVNGRTDCHRPSRAATDGPGVRDGQPSDQVASSSKCARVRSGSADCGRERFCGQIEYAVDQDTPWGT